MNWMLRIQKVHFIPLGFAPRRIALTFGRFWLLGKGESDAVTGVSKLGPEPSSKKLTAQFLKGKLAKSRRAVKEALLDQTVVAGIGNIYSDEILFEARIQPRRPARSAIPADRPAFGGRAEG